MKRRAIKCEVLDLRTLDEARHRAWEGLLTGASVYRNPNLSPRFAATVAVHRPTSVGMAWDRDRLVAVLPFHRLEGGACEALALGVSDYHGPVFCSDCGLSYMEFMKRLDIEEFRFDHLMADMQIKQRVAPWRPTHLINLAKGEMGYRWELRERNSSLWQEMLSLKRRVERDVGEVTFVPNLQRPEALDLLIGWKSLQFDETRIFNDFNLDWNAPFLHELLNVATSECSGMLSGIFVGDTPMALHMGSISSAVLQTCYTAYDRRFADYSPGALLLFFQVAYCLRHGISVLDLGKGDEPYKRRWANDRLWVAEGRLLI